MIIIEEYICMDNRRKYIYCSECGELNRPNKNLTIISDENIFKTSDYYASSLTNETQKLKSDIEELKNYLIDYQTTEKKSRRISVRVTI